MLLAPKLFRWHPQVISSDLTNNELAGRTHPQGRFPGPASRPPCAAPPGREARERHNDIQFFMLRLGGQRFMAAAAAAASRQPGPISTSMHLKLTVRGVVNQLPLIAYLEGHSLEGYPKRLNFGRCLRDEPPSRPAVAL